MGQFRFKKIYVNFDINGHHHRLEHDDDLLMKWSKMSNDYQQMAEQIEADPDGNPEDQIKLFKDFFKNELNGRSKRTPFERRSTLAMMGR